ncbi:MAG: VOC family protein [Moraxellaceae bacterium]|nr:VOC family protein [Moraxellaceae bacterium]
MNLSVIEMKAYVPARDFEVSKAFYTAIGFQIGWSSEDMAYLHHGSASFLLQNFYVAEHADNFMMHLLVENVDDWHARIVASGVAEKYGVRLDPPEDRPWGMRDFPFCDPTGVLWRIGQDIE